MVSPNEDQIEAGSRSFQLGRTEVEVYAATPKNGENLPAIFILHDSRGLTRHVENLVRCAAGEGFLAVAPDLFASREGTPRERELVRGRGGAGR